MTVIDHSLKWRSREHEFGHDERKILLALSHKKWKWHTLDSLRSAVRIEEHEFNSAMRELLDSGLVTGSYIRETHEPIFALVERVDGKSALGRIFSR